MASADFPDGYFSHVFIDEAGHAQEPEAVIAVSGKKSSLFNSISLGALDNNEFLIIKDCIILLL